MKRSQVYMLTGALLLGALFVWPMWNITLEAPQYPDPIGMNIHINRFEDAQPNDIKNINIMNHYVGMKYIPESITEFAIFPKVAIAMIALGVILAFVGRRKLYVLWFSLMMILGTIAMYDFYRWEYEYGHDLKENAAIKFTDKDGKPMAYQPPLIGAKMILNFRAISMPRLGAYLMFLGMGLSLCAFFYAKKENENSNPKMSIAALLLTSTLLSCSSGPQPINYGQDACAFCKMTIVDRQHAAQLVTKTGKAFKYDAIECMLNDMKEWEHPRITLYLVADYANPGSLTDASTASYLVSKEIPSPMGEFLTAFGSMENRDKVKSNGSDVSHDWHSLKEAFEVD